MIGLNSIRPWSSLILSFHFASTASSAAWPRVRLSGGDTHRWHAKVQSNVGRQIRPFCDLVIAAHVWISGCVGSDGPSLHFSQAAACSSSALVIKREPDDKQLRAPDKPLPDKQLQHTSVTTQKASEYGRGQAPLSVRFITLGIWSTVALDSQNCVSVGHVPRPLALAIACGAPWRVVARMLARRLARSLSSPSAVSNLGQR